MCHPLISNFIPASQCLFHLLPLCTAFFQLAPNASTTTSFASHVPLPHVLLTHPRFLPSCRKDKLCRPIAIELNGGDGEREVYTPADHPNLWLLAKGVFNSIDSGYHQLITHWLRTHACTEPYIISTQRNLSSLHPVSPRPACSNPSCTEAAALLVPWCFALSLQRISLACNPLHQSLVLCCVCVVHLYT
jgi:hypothetical protein